MRDLIILGGAGGMIAVYQHLREVYPDIKVAVLDERSTTDTTVACKDTLPVIKDWDFAPARKFFGLDDTAFRSFLPTFTYPKVKKMLVDKALAHGLEPAPTFVYPEVRIFGEVSLGVGGFIGLGTQIASDAKIGSYVSSGNAVIGHDVSVGDFCTVGTNTTLLGYCSIGEGVQVSPGAVIRTGVKVAPWVIIGIQAAVVSDIDKEGCIVGGVPAKEIHGKGIA
jgi:UDP-3-O-[3-hydroxymyristoyl] glucosamine N-acyltransferase